MLPYGLARETNWLDQFCNLTWQNYSLNKVMEIQERGGGGGGQKNEKVDSQMNRTVNGQKNGVMTFSASVTNFTNSTC